MSSMTIDQLKKTLTEQGVTLPASRLKKADYVKLYEQCTLNESLGDVYASDDENPPKTGSQNVTSSTSPGKDERISKEVEQLSDDELYLRLKEFDVNIGPVLKSTRRVYEKRLIKILTGGKQANGYESVKSQKEKYIPSVDEFSDSDVEIVSKSTKKTIAKGRKSSVLRDSPKPSAPESFESEIEESHSSKYDFSNRSSTPGYSNTSKPSRYSYIEYVPKGSSYSYIEPDTDVGYSSGDIRHRFNDKYNIDKVNPDRFGADKFVSDTFGSEKYASNISNTDDIYRTNIGIGDQYKSDLSTKYKGGSGSTDQYKSGFGSSGQYKSGFGLSSQYKNVGGGFGEHYTGTWEPNISRYLGAGTQKKVTAKEKSINWSGLAKTFLAGLLLLAIILLIIYLYHQWSVIDPYKMIEDDAERKIQELNEGSGHV